MRVAVVDCGSGNLASAVRALDRAARMAGIDAEVFVTAHPSDISGADSIVIPGQGAFATCAQGISDRGLWAAIHRAMCDGTVPVLGICVGMQLLAQRGLENAATPGFGWISGEVARLDVPGMRLPHMGWNALDFTPGIHPLLDGISPGDHVYFVHSYGLRDYADSQVLATADYGGAVPAIVAAGSVAGTQFHVEKSQEVGLRILANFLRWSP